MMPRGALARFWALRLRDWWRDRRAAQGLNTADDAALWAGALKTGGCVVAGPGPVAVPDVPVRTELDMRTPVYDQLWRDWTARLTRQRVADIFAEMVADWRCEMCRANEHVHCPGCSCPCGSPELVR